MSIAQHARLVHDGRYIRGGYPFYTRIIRGGYTRDTATIDSSTAMEPHLSL